ncbi:MAG TPA: beta/gamma crystallin-related protein [Xanthobacteraceae bacterium]|nr:beta/gamma crystallin-related protein [Xanthobacteraceae bacterium]
MSKIACGFIAAGVLAVSLPIFAAATVGTRAAPASGLSHETSTDTPTQPTDFSSRGRGGGGMRGGGGHRGGGGMRGGGHRGGGGMKGGGHRGGGGMKGGGHHGGGTRVGGTRVGGTRVGGTRVGGTRVGGTRVGGARVGGTRVGGTRVTTIRNRRFTTFAGRRFWWRGGWRTLIGVGLLTGFAIGPDFYYPEGYVALAKPTCTGYTDDGCALRWQDVATDDGSTIPQCVQFCPRVRKSAAPAAAPAPAAAAPRSGCEVEVFADKNLSGTSFKTTEDQPLLNDDWDKKIVSIRVISGTWDFSTEAQYGGDAMRLAPGSYRDLGPNWVDQISSFMCTQ